MGLAHLGNKDIQQAKTEMTEAVNLNPGWSEPRFLRADMTLQAGAFDLAIEDAQEILKNEPKSYRATLILGIAYFKQKRCGQSLPGF